MVYEICNQPLLFLDSGISTPISTENVSTSLKCHSTQGEWREQLSGNHLSNNEFHHQVAKKLQEFLLSWFVSLNSWLNWTLVLETKSWLSGKASKIFQLVWVKVKYFVMNLFSSRPHWTGLGAAWDCGRFPSHGRGWDWMRSRAPSNPNHPGTFLS